MAIEKRGLFINIQQGTTELEGRLAQHSILAGNDDRFHFCAQQCKTMPGLIEALRKAPQLRASQRGEGGKRAHLFTEPNDHNTLFVFNHLFMKKGSIV